MTKIHSVALFSFLMLAVLIFDAPGLAKRSCANDRTTLVAAINRLIDNDNTANLEGLLAGYSEDAVLLPPQGSSISGKSALRPHYERIFTTSRLSLSASVVEAKAEVNLGFVRGETIGSVSSRAGGKATAVDDKFLAVVRCEDGEWRVTHLMWSPTVSGK